MYTYKLTPATYRYHYSRRHGPQK